MYLQEVVWGLAADLHKSLKGSLEQPISGVESKMTFNWCERLHKQAGHAAAARQVYAKPEGVLSNSRAFRCGKRTDCCERLHKHAGHTEVSSGSSANGEAETLELRLRTAAAGASTGAHVAPQPQAAAEEPTVMVNRAPRPGLRRAAFPGLRAGPRRIGATHHDSANLNPINY